MHPILCALALLFVGRHIVTGAARILPPLGPITHRHPILLAVPTPVPSYDVRVLRAGQPAINIDGTVDLPAHTRHQLVDPICRRFHDSFVENCQRERISLENSVDCHFFAQSCRLAYGSVDTSAQQTCADMLGVYTDECEREMVCARTSGMAAHTSTQINAHYTLFCVTYAMTCGVVGPGDPKPPPSTDTTLLERLSG
jgi:hypothetical protein